MDISACPRHTRFVLGTVDGFPWISRYSLAVLFCPSTAHRHLALYKYMLGSTLPIYALDP